MNEAVRFIGGAADGPHHFLALQAQRREIIARSKRSAVLFIPGIEKQLLQFGHDRPPHFKMNVAPWPMAGGRRTLGERTAGIHAANVDAAQESRLAIDDEQFAVITLIHVPAFFELERVDRIEFDQIDAGIGQALEEFVWGLERADAIVDQIHLHALLLLLDEFVGEAPAHFVVVEYVRLHVDVVGSVTDGGEHRLEGRRADLQHRDFIAHHQRTADEGNIYREATLEDGGGLAPRLETVEDFPSLLDGQRAVHALELDGRMRAPRHVGNDSRQRAAAAQYQRQNDGGAGAAVMAKEFLLV